MPDSISLDKLYGKELDFYYGGNDVDVFFNNVFVDECTSIGYRSVTNSAPVYAYNHEKFNAIMKGNFRVEGKFSVNFKATGYVEYILKKGRDAKSGLQHQIKGNREFKTTPGVVGIRH